MADFQHIGNWSLASIVGGAERVPLVKWWLSAPPEALAMLWQSEVGDVSRHLILNPYPVCGPATKDHSTIADILHLRLKELDNKVDKCNQRTAAFISLLLLASNEPNVLSILPRIQPWLNDWWQSHRHTFLQRQRELPPAEQLWASPVSLLALSNNLKRCNTIRRHANILWIKPGSEGIAFSLREDRLLFLRLLTSCNDQQLKELVCQPSSRITAVYRSLFYSDLGRFDTLPEEQAILSRLEGMFGRIKGIQPKSLDSQDGQLCQLLAYILLSSEDRSQLLHCRKEEVPEWFNSFLADLLRAPSVDQPDYVA